MTLPKIIVNGAAGAIYLPDGLILPSLAECKEWLPVSLYAPQSKLVADAAVMWLLAQKLDNGGNYGAGDWYRIRAQRTRARQKLSLKSMMDGSTKLAWGMATSRLVVCFEKRAFDYQTGQSDNEELTNVMRRLVNPCAEHVS